VKAIAIIPCYNETNCISDVVFKVNEFVGLTMVVDDSSTDDTVAKAKDAGAYIVRRFGKRGFGAALKQGMNEAFLKDCEIIVTLDGDGQHDPNDTFNVIKPIEDGVADVVIGSRFLEIGNTIPRYRKFGIQVINWLYNVFSKQKVTDAQCCFRAYRHEVLRAISMNEHGFTFSTETLIKARALGFRITEVPVNVLYHKQYSQNSTLNPIKHGLSVAWGTVKLRLKVELWSKIKSMVRVR
jgi:glycosyltransferase involved in cell wall biosynthesis